MVGVARSNDLPMFPGLMNQTLNQGRKVRDKIKSTIPEIKPPMWAHQAIPPVCPWEPAALRNCMANQMPRKKKAGIFTMRKK